MKKILAVMFALTAICALTVGTTGCNKDTKTTTPKSSTSVSGSGSK